MFCFRYYLYHRGTWPPQLLLEVQPALNPYTLAKMHGVVIPARDGLRLPAYLSLPVKPGVPQVRPDPLITCHLTLCLLASSCCACRRYRVPPPVAWSSSLVLSSQSHALAAADAGCSVLKPEAVHAAAAAACRYCPSKSWVTSLWSTPTAHQQFHHISAPSPQKPRHWMSENPNL